VKIVLCLAILITPALWADEAADRTAIKATIAALNSSLTPASIFTADFPYAAELQHLRETPPTFTVVISREPWGEATWYSTPPRFLTRSVTFVAPDTAVVVATYERQPVLFVVKLESSSWRIASFRTLPEAQPKLF
jgi:hypothetical protein